MRSSTDRKATTGGRRSSLVLCIATLLASGCDEGTGDEADGGFEADGPEDGGSNVDDDGGDSDDSFAEICASQQTEADCMGQTLNGEANDACAWATVYQPEIQGQACNPGEPTYLCVHIAGEQAGCGADVCEGAEDTRVYLKDDGTGAVLRLTACGRELVSNEWSSCAASGLPVDDRTRCRCGCQ